MDDLTVRLEALKLAQEWVLSFEEPQHDDVLPLADAYVEWVVRRLNGSGTPKVFDLDGLRQLTKYDPDSL